MNTNSSIHGIGNDIIEISRIKMAIEKNGSHFLNRIFTQKEQEYCLRHKNPYPHFAGHFAAKESVAKAFGTGFGEHISFVDIEILHDKYKKPYILLAPHIEEKFNKPKILISISHSKHYATGVAIWF